MLFAPTKRRSKRFHRCGHCENLVAKASSLSASAHDGVHRVVSTGGGRRALRGVLASHRHQARVNHDVQAFRGHRLVGHRGHGHARAGHDLAQTLRRHFPGTWRGRPGPLLGRPRHLPDVEGGARAAASPQQDDDHHRGSPDAGRRTGPHRAVVFPLGHGDSACPPRQRSLRPRLRVPAHGPAPAGRPPGSPAPRRW